MRVPAPTLARLLSLPSRIKGSHASDVASSRQSSAHQSSRWSLIPERTVGETNYESLQDISENAWDGQFLVAEGLPNGCFGCENFDNSLVCQVCSASLGVLQKYAAVSKLWARCCSLLGKVTKRSKSCDCVQEEKAVSRGETQCPAPLNQGRGEGCAGAKEVVRRGDRAWSAEETLISSVPKLRSPNRRIGKMQAAFVSHLWIL